MEQLDYNILFRWFVGMDMDEPLDADGVDQETRSPLESRAGPHLFRRVLDQAQA